MNRIGRVFIANQTNRLNDASESSYEQPQPQDVLHVLEDLRHLQGDYQNHEAMLAFEEQQSLVATLIEMLPPGPSYRDFISWECASLNLNPVQNDTPTSWLRALKQLLTVSPPASQSQRDLLKQEAKAGHQPIMLPSKNGPFIMNELAKYQSDRVISAYILFERVFKTEYTSFREQQSHSM
jgi:hypothetical protein